MRWCKKDEWTRRMEEVNRELQVLITQKDAQIESLQESLAKQAKTLTLVREDLGKATERWKKAVKENEQLKSFYCEADWRPTRSCNADDPNMEGQ